MVIRYSICVIALYSMSLVQCMEQAHRWLDVKFYEQPNYVITQPQCPITTVITTANQPGWQRLDDIMNAPYVAQSIELQPLYKKVSREKETPSEKIEQNRESYFAAQACSVNKPLLCTNSLVRRDNTEQMRKLCNKISSLMSSEYERYEDCLPKLNICISGYDKAKQHNITEDQLGEFALDCDNSLVAIFCSCLKHYNKNRSSDQANIVLMELVPLAKSLDLSSGSFGKESEVSLAMKIFLDDVFTIKALNVNSQIKRLAKFLHSEKKLEIINDDFIIDDFNKEEWKNAFLYEVFSFCSEGFGVFIGEIGLRYIIALFDKGKKLNFVTSAHELGEYALQYKVTMADSFLMVPLLVPYASQKQKIALFCALIEKYNRSRASKITPTEKVMKCSAVAKHLHIAYPEAFDNRLFDDKCIAFKEYDQLRKDIEILLNSSDDVIRKCVNIKYPNK